MIVASAELLTRGAQLLPSLLALALGAAGFVILFFATERLALRSPSTAGRVLEGGLFLIALLGILTFFATFVVYAGTNVLSDHAESWNLCLAWSWGHGAPLYHQMDAVPRYSSAYGPGLYVVLNLILQLVQNPIFCKLVIGALLLIGILLVWMSCRPASGLLSTVVATGYFVLALSGMTPYAQASYWLRAEPLLIFSAASAIIGSTRPRAVVAATVVAFALGTATAFKPHGAIYVLPAIGILYSRFGFKVAVCSALGGAFIGGLFFTCFPGVDARNYLKILGMTARHGINFRMFSGNVFRLLIISVPLFVFGYWNLVVTRRFLRSVMRAHFPFVGTLFIGLVVALVPASKVGAGPHHLLPFLPWLYWVALSELSHLSADGNQIQGKEGRVLALASSFVLIWLFVPAAERCRRFASEVLAAARAEEAIPGEVRGILHQFRGRNLAMGTAGNDTAHLVLHKWRLVIAGNSYLFEPSAIMDYVYAGFPLSEETIATMTNGSIEGWVIPAGGEPFSMTNLYDFNQKLFPERMLEEFRRNYVIEYSTQHFDVWVYRQRE